MHLLSAYCMPGPALGRGGVGATQAQQDRVGLRYAGVQEVCGSAICQPEGTWVQRPRGMQEGA